MAQEVQVSVRMSAPLLARIERLHAVMERSMPGVTRVLVIRSLIESGLAAEEARRGISPDGNAPEGVTTPLGR